MASSAALTAVKLALDVTVTDYDAEIGDLIDAALLDLQSSGVDVSTMGNDKLVMQAVKTSGVDVETMGNDKLVLQAIKTYCRMNFQSPADYDRLERSYAQQVVKLMHATGYTDYGEEAVDG